MRRGVVLFSHTRCAPRTHRLPGRAFAAARSLPAWLAAPARSKNFAAPPVAASGDFPVHAPTGWVFDAEG